MIVTPIAHTYFDVHPESVVHTKLAQRSRMFGDAEDIDYLHEFAGRACYQSWDLPNPKTAENHDYIANILAQQHESVLEHGSVTFYVEGVSRSLTHELIRHRHLSFSELSQRYVDMSEAKFVRPPALDDALDKSYTTVAQMCPESAEDYEGWTEYLVTKGLPRKQAREAARAFMPNATETKIVVTGNLRAWRDVLKKRWHVAADAEIREFAGEALRHLRDIAPASVQDMPLEPFGTEVAA